MKFKIQIQLLLAVIAIFAAACQRDGIQRSSVAKMQITEFENALKMFRSDMNRHPTNAEGLDVLVHNPGLKGWNGPYLRKVFPDTWGRPYIYKCPGEHDQYDIYSLGRDGIAGTDDDIVSWAEKK
jgi:general secretion pathway protein G